MHFEFFKQRHDGKISADDEIALYSDDDAMPSGRWKVASLGADPGGEVFATLVGMGHIEGYVAQVPISAHE